MTDHIKVKHKVQQIPSKIEFKSLLENAMLSEKEKKLMELHYIWKYDFGYIADELGYSKAGVVKMHQRILKRIEALI